MNRFWAALFPALVNFGGWPSLWLVLALFYGAQSTFAKDVKIQWKAISGAAQYEIQIQQDGRIITKKSVDAARWEGELDAGAYSFQIRAIDRVKRPGQWSDWRPLAVMPPPPKPKYPPDGGQVLLYHPGASTLLKWEAVPGIQKYTVDLKKDGRLVSQTRVEGTQLEIKALPPGNYSWGVRPILQASDRSPASLKGKSWEAPKSDLGEFRVEHKKLDAPRLKSPKEILAPPEDGKVELHWKEVEGAEGYEVHLLKTKKLFQDRTLASDLLNVKAFRTRATSLSSRIQGEGSYVWGVRALANLDEKNVPQAVGPESITRFGVDRNAVFHGDLGFVALSMMIAPYSYQIVSPMHGFQGTAGATAMAARLSGEYYFNPNWGLSAGMDYSFFTILNQNFGRPNVELLAKYRMKLGTDQYGWFFSPKLGFELRDYLEIYPSNTNNFLGGLSELHVFALGGSAGFDIRKQFTQKLSVGIKVNYYYPFAFVGAASGSTSQGSPSSRNVSIGAQGMFWASQAIGLGAGVYTEWRSISFTPPGRSSQEQVYMDGSYFFGSVVLRFWK